MKQIAATCLLLLTCGSLLAADPLPSWHPGATRSAIIQFVEAVTRQGSPDFVPPAERIAVFDNDGTLWCEQPAYPQFLFGMDRVKTLGPSRPEWQSKEPFKSALAGDLAGVTASGVHGLIELTVGSHGGLTTTEFDHLVTDWMTTARHPRFQRRFNECLYQPMLELLAYLRSHGFKSYIVSGGGLDFMRPWAPQAYDLPPEQIIGSTVRTRHELRDKLPVLVRTAEIDVLNDREEKVLSIHRTIGRRPIAAFGNSDGDFPMLQWTAAGPGRRFCAYVHHTDARREYAYDREAKVGRLDRGLVEATERLWTVIDMRRDWKRVFPFQPLEERETGQ